MSVCDSVPCLLSSVGILCLSVCVDSGVTFSVVAFVFVSLSLCLVNLVKAASEANVKEQTMSDEQAVVQRNFQQ